jgi:hypothetical protein
MVFKRGVFGSDGAGTVGVGAGWVAAVLARASIAIDALRRSSMDLRPPRLWAETVAGRSVREGAEPMSLMVPKKKAQNSSR